MQSWSSLEATAHFGRRGVLSRVYTDWGLQHPMCSQSDLDHGCSSGTNVSWDGYCVQPSHPSLLSLHTQMQAHLPTGPYAWVSQMPRQPNHQKASSLRLWEPRIHFSDIKQGVHMSEHHPWEQPGDHLIAGWCWTYFNTFNRFALRISYFQLRLVAHTCNPNSEEAKAG